MKTLKILNCGLLVLAAMCAVTAVFAFVKGDIMHGVSNILWMRSNSSDASVLVHVSQTSKREG